MVVLSPRMALAAGVVGVLGLVVTLAVPWYAATYEPDVGPGHAVLLWGWRQAFCTGGCTGSGSSWRSEAMRNVGTVFDIAGALTGVALFCSVISTFYLFKNTDNRVNQAATRMALNAALIAAPSFLVLALIVFAAAYNPALTADGYCDTIFSMGGCRDFVTSLSMSGLTVHWRPAGWIGGWVVFIYLVFVAYTLFKSADPASAAYAQGINAGPWPGYPLQQPYPPQFAGGYAYPPAPAGQYALPPARYVAAPFPAPTSAGHPGYHYPYGGMPYPPPGPHAYPPQPGQMYYPPQVPTAPVAATAPAAANLPSSDASSAPLLHQDAAGSGSGSSGL